MKRLVALIVAMATLAAMGVAVFINATDKQLWALMILVFLAALLYGTLPKK